MALLAWGGRSLAQGVDVSATMTLGASGNAHKAAHGGLSEVVVWLEPVDGSAAKAMEALLRSGYRLVQKNKMFTPHLLVVPTGSSVEFPNLDPFFHNVFSLFNGKRFDLGLYEAGTHKSVHFDREGVSYIFCNIHPEMGAIVLALSTPYFAISNADGTVTVHGVPAGRYRVHLWSEHYQLAHADGLGATLNVTTQPASLGAIELMAAGDPLTHHMNKFGEEYPPAPHAEY
jgi:plastocyanin